MGRHERTAQSTGTLLLDQIRSTLPSASEAELRFARYVAERDDVVYKSITEVIDESGASYGTVIRYCKKLGCSGFQDFKIRLASESSLVASSNRSIAEVDDDLVITREYVEQLVTAARNTTREKVEAITDSLLAAGRILVMGVGGSHPTAMEIAYRLVRLGLHPTSEADEHMQAIRASNLGRGDVLFVVSFSGSTKGILEAARIAKRRGATVVAMTNFLRSPLARIADYSLFTMLREQALDAEIGSRIPFTFLVEILTRSLRARGAGAADALKRTSDSVSDKQI
jgi:RpiR family transcriptional regulator, carbohydrate utilization regulator